MSVYDKDNIFAKILRGEVNSAKVYEDENVLAFNDAFPKTPTHILVIPKGEYVSFDDFVSKSNDEQIATFFKTVHKIAQEQGLSEKGYRILSNHKESAGQCVFHFHVHIMAW